MKEKLTTLTINIPYKRAGNVISQQPVGFDVFDNDDHFALVPLLSTEDSQVANLPDALKFVVENDRPVSLRGKKDGNFHAIGEAWNMLKEQGVVLSNRGR